MTPMIHPTSITELIARLGHACGLPWARCGGSAVDATFLQKSKRGRVQCGNPRGCTHHSFAHVTAYADPVKDGDPLPPTIAEWAPEWEREHPGEPGPTWEWTSEDGRVWWCVNDFGVNIRIGRMVATRGLCGNWDIGGVAQQGDDAPRELVRLMQAVDGKK